MSEPKITTERGRELLATDNSAEPAPISSNGEAIWDLVIADMRERDSFGEKKYNQRLTSGDGRRSIVDAYQEVLDLGVYLKKEIVERAVMQARIRELEAALDAALLRCGELEADKARLLAALKQTLPRLAHQFECMSTNPVEDWLTKGSWNSDKCCCVIATAEAAIDAAKEKA